MAFGDKPTYEQLQQRVAQLERRSDDRQMLKNKLATHEAEFLETTLQMEQAIERANRMAAEAEIANLEFSQILNTVVDAIWVVDKNYKVMRINQSFSKLINETERNVIGKNCHDVLKATICSNEECPMKKVLRTRQSKEIDTDILTRDGAVPFLMTMTPFLGFEGKPIGVLCIFKNIAERKKIETDLQKANEELTRLSVIDSLTKIANRRQFDLVLANEWKRMSREKKYLSLILCDVDFFKKYNDTYGHQKGDECLKMVASGIKDTPKRACDVVARYGGEEFGIILPGTDDCGAAVVAEKIKSSIETLKIPHKSSSVREHVTLSLGVASILLPKTGTCCEHLLKTADQALYAAKENGRNCWVSNSLNSE